jgi:ABC-type transport system involved in multi-copper enzyme maturation permease subunit
VIWLLYLRVIVPILGVFYGTSLMADEVEDKTITYLFVRPIRRGAVSSGNTSRTWSAPCSSSCRR